ncbi:diphthine--ammonia ligase family protein [Aspergillus mulundensis]|uniref:Diphthine--ammonia ligase n=1 Tax=Aspergillus mulundensis TaxID=1810919 RepID=A0A3D8S4U4_9EURO|nr:hypothetical protein DSM5745_04874 [Aspergillus mulundensis]RDW81317.1 hypothetical protein DSM5745_04874 [Aspergillus mulundensis]
MSLNVIALISGGKDSLYSILHCIRNGHKVVALANLHPPPLPATTTSSNSNSNDVSTADDIDSFMYQTIGWSVIPLYEEALGIPLYRAPIIGGAVDAGRVYGDATTAGEEDEDETESLIPLLKKVMAAHPEANAVCAGAILSTYQRTRIEDVAGRLGLVPLAWLWQYPFLPAEARSTGAGEDEAGLLSDMAAVGCSARIVKVASGALDEGFLWGDVADASGGLRRRIVKGVKRFQMGGGEDIRGAVVGEGGEYETLAVDGPGFLWKGRIDIADEGREVRRGEGGVGYLRLSGARVVSKSQDEEDGVTPGDVRRPVLLDGEFAGALDGLWDGDEGGGEEGVAMREDYRASWTFDEPVQSVNGGLWTVANIAAPEVGPGAAEQMAAIVRKIQKVLATPITNGTLRSTADIVFTTVLLRSMADFPSMNGIYVSLFDKPNPPARATVACGDSLPEGVNVMVSMVVDLGPRAQRDGLHVQSRSYWAPANIGPYSQAQSVPLQGTERVVYIAGQIPLEPASMDLVEVEKPSAPGGPSWAETYSLRAVLSLQHMWRIGAAMEVGWWLGTVAFFTGSDHTRTRAQLAWKLWQKMHDASLHEDEEEDEDSTLDVWDIKYGRRGHEQTQTISRPQLPNFELVEASEPKTQVPAFFAVQVHELPRNSDIEWQGLGYRCNGVKLTRSETEFGRTTDATTNENFKYSCIEIDSAGAADLESQIQRVLEVYKLQPGTSHCIIYTSQPLPQDCCQGQIVPCKSVWGAEGTELAAGVIIQRQT